ncbi:hypothetical protein CR513_34050, partial [Mucuna pruriens]
MLRKGLLNRRNQRRMKNLLVTSIRKVNLTFMPKDIWYVDFGAITHLSVTMQGFLWSRPLSDDEIFIFVCDDNKVVTFVVLSFRHNLISISTLDKFGFSCSFGNNKVSLYQNSNVIDFGYLINNLYMLDVVTSHNKILKTSSQDICGHFPTTSWNRQQYFITFIDNYSRYVKLQLGKKIKFIKFDCCCEYYGKYDESGEQHPRPFKMWNVLQYTMLGKHSMYGYGEKYDQSFFFVRDTLGRSFKDQVYILNKVPSKSINKIPYELWTGKRPNSNTCSTTL